MRELVRAEHGHGVAAGDADEGGVDAERPEAVAAANGVHLAEQRALARAQGRRGPGRGGDRNEEAGEDDEGESCANTVRKVEKDPSTLTRSADDRNPRPGDTRRKLSGRFVRAGFPRGRSRRRAAAPCRTTRPATRTRPRSPRPARAWPRSRRAWLRCAAAPLRRAGT